MVDKVASREKRQRHYSNYAALLEKSKFKNDAEVARKTGICQSSFTDWKQGVSEPKMDKIIAISKLFRVSPYKIID